MGNFREFIETQVGLGNLGSRIFSMYHNQEFDTQIGGALASTDVTGSEQSNTHSYSGHPLYLPSTDLTVPATVKTGRIELLSLKTNPIKIRLSDGTEGLFTWDEFKRIEGEPKIGKTMTITFQRSPQDLSKNHSKIDKAKVID